MLKIKLCMLLSFVPASTACFLGERLKRLGDLFHAGIVVWFCCDIKGIYTLYIIKKKKKKKKRMEEEEEKEKKKKENIIIT